MAQIKYNLGDLGTDKYSTDEQVIGTWIDGKPLYRKVFKNVAVPSGSTWTTMIDLSDLRPEHLSINLNSDFYITIDPAKVRFIIDSQMYFSTALNGNNLITYINNNSYSYIFSNLILEYTKKTD